MRSFGSILRIIGVACAGYLLFEIAAWGQEDSVFEQQPWLWAVYFLILTIYVAGEISAQALKSILYKTLKPEAKEAYDREASIAKDNQFLWLKTTYIKLLGSKPLEEEGEIILDHNYDGIQELDNKLPPWWVYGFYASIVFAIVYMVRFEVFDDYNQVEEYEAAVAQANLEIAEWKKTAKYLIDINNVELLTDASDLKAGEQIFAANCIACHKEGGGGGIGPNLTDDYWILGGGVKNVFHTTSEGGRDGKGMVAWKSDLKPSEMAQVASYVLSLRGTNPPDAKEPQGDLWKDPNAAEEVGEAIIDSAATANSLENITTEKEISTTK